MSDTQTLWAIDPVHSTVEFSMKSFFLFVVKGRFADFSGNIVLNESDVERSAVAVALKTASIETGSKSRDTRLRSAAFLDAQRYPEIRFESSKVEPGRDRDTLRVSGLLTIKENSRKVTLDVEQLDHSRSPDGEELIYYGTSTVLNRSDFGLGHGWRLFGHSLRVMVNLQASRRERRATGGRAT